MEICWGGLSALSDAPKTIVYRLASFINREREIIKKPPSAELKPDQIDEDSLPPYEVLDKNEYKRKQSAPGLKVITKAFGVGRRMPIASKHYFKK